VLLVLLFQGSLGGNLKLGWQAAKTLSDLC
jgi:hypothetical protein